MEPTDTLGSNEVDRLSPTGSVPALSQEEEEDVGSGSNQFITERYGTRLIRCERHHLPDTFNTSNLLFYDRFKAYQDYMLGDCKPSEVRTFTADYLEKVVEPCDWLALWITDVFDVLVEVHDVDLKGFKAEVQLVLPVQCDSKGSELNPEALEVLLEATQHKVPLQDLVVVYEESGDLDQTALALEHLRFFYQHIWRRWDEEDEDDEFDYFVRCVEPRLRLHYDILEGRLPVGLVTEYQSLLEQGSQCFITFSELRNSLSTESDSELDNVSMVEGLKLYDQLETLKGKLHIMENPLLRLVTNSVHSRGSRSSGQTVVHVVSSSCTISQLQSLLSTRMMTTFSSEDSEIQFHREPTSAVDSCYEGDLVLVLPGTYDVSSSISIADSITMEGFGFPDDVVIEKKNKGDSFVECSGAEVRLSNIKFIQNDSIEGIICEYFSQDTMENCVLQSQTTGVIVRTSASLTMKQCDLYGSKGAGVEIYPGSVCSLIGNGIHHCKDGVLIKDFADELNLKLSITMENNVIHNNEGYGVYLVKPCSHAPNSALATQNQQEGLSDLLPVQATPTSGSSGADTQLCSSSLGRRQPIRGRGVSSSQAVEDLSDHNIFGSIKGNEFRRNGLGDFGTFFY
uniref:Right handed beta helix domain-containing protein n=1 Tax=Gouania willdenowi TaxID=441366 RepID=A0A8C5G864_GOUWI